MIPEAGLPKSSPHEKPIPRFPLSTTQTISQPAKGHELEATYVCKVWIGAFG